MGLYWIWLGLLFRKIFCEILSQFLRISARMLESSNIYFYFFYFLFFFFGGGGGGGGLFDVNLSYSFLENYES